MSKRNFLLKYDVADLLFLIFISCASAYFYWYVYQSTVPPSDGVEFLNNARSWSDGSQLNSPFRAPLISWISAFIWNITGENWIIIKYLMPAFTPAAVIILYLTLRKNKSTWFALGVSALTMLNTQLFFWGTHIMTEGLSLFFLTLSLYFMKSEKSSNWLLGGISAGLTFAARYTISLQAIAIFVTESITRRNPKFVIKTLMTMLPMIALVAMIVYFKTGTFSGAVQEDTQFTILLSPYYLLHSFDIWGMAFILVPVAFFFKRTYTDKNNFTYIVWFLVSLLFWSANASNHQERFMLQTTPAVYYLAILAIENITSMNILRDRFSEKKEVSDPGN